MESLIKKTCLKLLEFEIRDKDVIKVSDAVSLLMKSDSELSLEEAVEDCLNELEDDINTINCIILSPDGVPINPEGWFRTKKEADSYFYQWTERYIDSGYSLIMDGGRLIIPFSKIKSYCTFIYTN